MTAAFLFLGYMATLWFCLHFANRAVVKLIVQKSGAVFVTDEQRRDIGQATGLVFFSACSLAFGLVATLMSNVAKDPPHPILQIIWWLAVAGYGAWSAKTASSQIWRKQ
ncbi:hypothetical protein [Ruegeria jejuensis]|uniref:hypothetical protein n=1 Tax=Ruegeria jejuensis TaxID=3233338 RepID=UPI00355BDC2B